MSTMAAARGMAAITASASKGSGASSLSTTASAAPRGAHARRVRPTAGEQGGDARGGRHLRHAYRRFPGEGHGFRGAAAIIRSFEGELSSYGQVLGFPPADTLEPIEVQFLEGVDPAM